LNKCKHCGIETTNEKFCSRSCAASVNNRGIVRNGRKHEPYNCIVCGTEKYARPQQRARYCSIKCQQKYQHDQRIQEWKTSGKIGKTTLKKYLIDTWGHYCYVCGIGDWNGKTIVLELEHKNGKSWDNSEENVALICPNCHSQTDTYKGANRGNGRYTRRKRYHLGLSY